MVIINITKDYRLNKTPFIKDFRYKSLFIPTSDFHLRNTAAFARPVLSKEYIYVFLHIKSGDIPINIL